MAENEIAKPQAGSALAKSAAWWEPKDIEEAMKLATMIANSDLAPKDYRGKPGNVLIAMQMGYEVGLSPMAAIQNIAVINGRPSVWGDAMLAICQAHAAWGGMTEEKPTKENDMTARCVVRRRGQEPTVGEFSKARAEKAGLWTKEGPWRNYPERMIQLRARAYALRDAFADALRGLDSAEEQSDLVEVAIVDTSAAQAEPKRSKAKQLKADLGLDAAKPKTEAPPEKAEEPAQDAPPPADDFEPADIVASLSSMMKEPKLKDPIKALVVSALGTRSRVQELDRGELNRLYSKCCDARDAIAQKEGGAA